MSDDLAARAVLVVVMAGTGVGLLAMARSAADGRLRRNGLVGIRTAATMASDEAWLAGHVAAERPSRWAGWAAIVAAVPALLPVDVGVGIAASLAGCAVVLTLVVRAAVVAGRAARASTPGRSTAGTSTTGTSTAGADGAGAGRGPEA